MPTPTLLTQASLAWTAPASQPAGVTLTGYVLEQQLDTAAFTKVGDLPVTPTTSLVAGLLPNHTYTWRVMATGRLANGSIGQSAPANNGVPPPCVAVFVVPAPLNLSVVPQ